jgi:hypothetical protein
MTEWKTSVEAMRAAFAAAGLDPTGIDLEWLAGIKDETERKVASFRGDPDFLAAAPAFNPPETMKPRQGGSDGAA